MKLRTPIGFFAIEFPTVQFRLAGETTGFELRLIGLALRCAGQLLEIVTNNLIEAFSHPPRRFAGAFGCFFIDGKGDVHNQCSRFT